MAPFCQGSVILWPEKVVLTQRDHYPTVFLHDIFSIKVCLRGVQAPPLLLREAQWHILDGYQSLKQKVASSVSNCSLKKCDLSIKVWGSRGKSKQRSWKRISQESPGQVHSFGKEKMKRGVKARDQGVSEGNVAWRASQVGPWEVRGTTNHHCLFNHCYVLSLLTCLTLHYRNSIPFLLPSTWPFLSAKIR